MSVDLNKEVYINMRTDDDSAIMSVNIPEMDADIKTHEEFMNEVDMDLCQNRPLTLDPDLREWIDKHSPDIQANLLVTTTTHAYIDFLKLKKIVQAGIIQKKDFSRLGDLYLKKLKSNFDIQMEGSDEMVQLGLIDEAVYIKHAMGMKNCYLGMEETLKFYNQCVGVYVTNNKIIAVRN